MGLGKHSALLPLFILLSSATLVGCGVIRADEPTPRPTPNHQAIAEAEVSRIMAERRAARTPWPTPKPKPKPTYTLAPTITLVPIDIETILSEAALAAGPLTTPISSQSPAPTATPSPIPAPNIAPTTDGVSDVLSGVGLSTVAAEIPRLMAGVQSLVSTPTPMPTATQIPTSTPLPYPTPFAQNDAVIRLKRHFGAQFGHEAYRQIRASSESEVNLTKERLAFWLARMESVVGEMRIVDGQWVVEIASDEWPKFKEWWNVFEKADKPPTCIKSVRFSSRDGDSCRHS